MERRKEALASNFLASALNMTPYTLFQAHFKRAFMLSHMNRNPYKKQIKQLLKNRSEAVLHFKSLRSEAEDSDERNSLLRDESFEVGMIDDEIEGFESQYLLDQARSLILPVPDHDSNEENWLRSQFTGSYQLTKNGMQKVRTTIRIEKKEKRESIIVWIAGLTGVIGALSGLIAIWNN